MPPILEHFVPAWTRDSERIIATPSPFAKSNLLFIQEIGHFRTYPPYFTERERLDSFLLAFTVNGTGNLLYRNETIRLREGQLFFIDCMHYHRYWTEPDDTWELFWVHFNGQSARGYHQLFMDHRAPLLDMPADSGVQHMIAQMIPLQKQKSLANELVSARILTEMLTSCMLLRQPTESAKNTMPGYIQDMVSEITSQYAQRLTLDGLARRFAVSKYHLSKQFKRYTGFTPNEYLINARLTKAKEWLKYSERSVADIAADVGIDNVSHFINLFRSREGITPHHYRKQWQLLK